MEQEIVKKPGRLEVVINRFQDCVCFAIVAMAVMGDCLCRGVLPEEAIDEIWKASPGLRRDAK
jgi:hypothetical protein